MSSGMNEVRKNVWAYRKNKSIKKKNSKVVNQNNIESDVLVQEALEATPENMPLEIVAFRA